MIALNINFAFPGRMIGKLKIANRARLSRREGLGAAGRQRGLTARGSGQAIEIRCDRSNNFRGRDRVAWAFTFAATAYNLVRLPKLIAGTG